MTPESANICSQLLTPSVATRRARNPTPSRPQRSCSRVTENNGLPTIAPVAGCSFLYRNTFSWELAFGLGSSDLVSEVGRKGNGPYESREVCTPALFVRDNVGQVLQRGVSSNRNSVAKSSRLKPRFTPDARATQSPESQ